MSRATMPTLKFIRSQCDEVGDCWLWRNGCSKTGYPCMHLGGKTVYTRRLVCEMQGLLKDDRKKDRVTASCEDSRCCNPEHLEVVTRSTLVRRLHAAGVFNTIAYRATMSRMRAPYSRLTMEQAREIRASPDKRAVLAEKFAVSLRTISDIRTGKYHVDYSNPYLSLMV